jgi:hypothetical protein
MSLLSAGAAARENGASAIFVGELRSVTLTRRDHVMQGRQPDSLILSNSCGDETAVLRVIRSTPRVRTLQTVRFTIGEWCQLPIEFPHDHWLIVRGSGSDNEPIQFPVYDFDGTVAALVTDEAAYRRELSEADQRRLAIEPLPTPVEYPLYVDLNNDHERDYISRQSSLAIRDNKVWVVRGILLTSVFPGFSPGDLLHRRNTGAN